MGFADVPPPVQYAPRENLGVSLSQAIGQSVLAYQQQTAANDAKEFQTAFGQAYAKGDMNAMQQLAQAHPAQWQQVQQGMTAINQNNRQQLGAAASDLSLAAMSGDPQAVANVAAAHGDTLQAIGVTPEGIATAYQQNPQQVKQYADMVGMHALEPQAYFQLQNQTAQRIQQGNYQQGQLQQGAQRLQQQQQAVNQQGAYQAAQIQQGQQKLTQDADFNRAKVLDMQASRAAQQGKTLAEQQSLQSKSMQAKQSLVDTFDKDMMTLGGSAQSLGQVQALAPDDFDSAFGIVGTQMRKVPGSTASQVWGQIEGLQAQARLAGIIGMKGTGPVSDAEGQAAARAFLNINEKTNAAAARKALDNYQSMLNRQKTYMQSRQPQIDQYRQQLTGWLQNQQQQQQGAGYAQQAPAPSQAGAQGNEPVSWGSLKR